MEGKNDVKNLYNYLFAVRATWVVVGEFAVRVFSARKGSVNSINRTKIKIASRKAVFIFPSYIKMTGKTSHKRKIVFLQKIYAKIYVTLHRYGLSI